MDIKQLDYFIKVCESGSFTAAAKKYFISPQGINMAVIRLEKELGKKLFIREKNSVVMTKDGEYLYKKAQEIIGCVNECEAHFQRNFTRERSISLSLIEELTCALPDEVYDVIMKNYSLSIRTGGSYSCEKNVIEGISTFAMVNAPPFDPRLVYRYCFSKKRLLIVNIDHPLARKKRLKLKELAEYPFVMPDPTFKSYDEFISLCKKAGFEPNIVFHANTISSTLNLLRRNKDIIGMTFDFCVLNEDLSGMKILDCPDIEWPWNIFFTYKKNARLGKKEKEFMNEFLGKLPRGNKNGRNE